MYTFILVIHVIAAFLLIVVILVQRGRGGGLVESFSGVESMFGTKTSQFLTRITAIFATVFLISSITLAVLAARQSRSLIDEREVSDLQQESVGQEQAVEAGMPVTESDASGEQREEIAEEQSAPVDNLAE